MSHLLWKYYWENDVDKFRRHLGLSSHTQQSSKNPPTGVGSPGAFGTSPHTPAKSRKVSGPSASLVNSKSAGHTLTKNDVNSRDHAGLTLLLRASSSTSPNAILFVEALLDHPATDIYIQDAESGWNALHRALYNGNVSTARLLLERERRELRESLGGTISRVGHLIKTKDHEGNSPFDVYNATIALRSLKTSVGQEGSDNGSDDDDDTGQEETWLVWMLPAPSYQSLIDFLIGTMLKGMASVRKYSHLEAIKTSPLARETRMIANIQSVYISSAQII